VIGCFIQTRPFFVDFADDPAFAEVLQRTARMSTFSSDIRRPAPKDVIARFGVENVLVNYVQHPRIKGDDVTSTPTPEASVPSRPSDLRAFQMAPRGIHRLSMGMTKLPQKLRSEVYRDLHLAFVKRSADLQLTITYASDHFAESEVEKLFGKISRILERATRSPVTAISSLV
jgi:hypothetical protein